MPRDPRSYGTTSIEHEPDTLFLSAACAAVGLAAGALLNPHVALPSIVVAIIIALPLKMANVWQELATA